MKAAATPNVDEGAMTAAIPTELLLPPTDPARSMVLGAGILAVAYTYRRVWLNFAPGRKQ
ncbi:hypothetical protein BGE01nite_42650 [Brevifollis gellanilyticus]|uniref:PEP-CTERM protein-sorting domain-containing protein n=2 Tax=Brevifollis gellanilyticus TaxID=748831 RepID=A0A512ME13_9BACT|nr:hypothetical protein BGE01nite_42650 [Brevifollis gellanilyticus]